MTNENRMYHSADYGPIPLYVSYGGALAVFMDAWMPGVDKLKDIPDAFVQMGKEVERLVDHAVAETAKNVWSVLPENDRAMLQFALGEAQEKIWSQDGFTHEDQESLDRLKALLTKEKNA